jgi:hypothetical protein
MRIILTLIILAWIGHQDYKTREITDSSWILLCLTGLSFFLFDLRVAANPQPLINMFLISVLCGGLLSVVIWKLLEIGDALVFIGLSMVVYNVAPFPAIVYILSPAATFGVLYGLSQLVRRVKIDVPFTIPIGMGYLVSLVG